MPVSEDVFNKVFAEIDSRQNEFIEKLREVVEIPSVSSDPERREDCVRMSLWAKLALEKLGATTELVFPGIQQGTNLDLPPIVLATLGNDPKKKTLLVYGHLDVQPAAMEDGWNTEPFKLIEIDGKLFGRGSTDDKGPVLGWLHAISVLQQLGIDLPINMKFCFECMEESGSEGLDETLIKLKDTFLKGVDFTCISDNYWLGTSKPCLTYGLRGLCYFNVEVCCAKQDLHSGVYGGSVPEAMNDLVKILAKLADYDGKINIPGLYDLVAPLTEEEKKIYPTIDFCKESFKNSINARGLIKSTKEELLMSRWRYPALSIHGIEGAFSDKGSKTVIPSKVTGKFSIRIVPDMTPEAVNKLVIDHLNNLWKEHGSANDFKVTAAHGGKPWKGDYDDGNFKAGSRALKRVYKVDPDYTREGGSIPVTLTFQELTGKSVMLLPVGACDDMAHSQNEKINKSNYIEGTKVLASYLLELADYQ